MVGETRAGTPYLGRFALVVFGAMVAVIAVRIVVAQVFAYALPLGATATIPPMAAALHVGQVWSKALGAVPAPREMWRFAGFGALIYLALRLPLSLLALVGMGSGGTAMGLAVVLELFVALASLLLIRFLLANAARGQVKTARR